MPSGGPHSFQMNDSRSTLSRTLSRDEFLYPPLCTNRTGRLQLDARHTMYWEESGNPRGVPVVFLHGGPGGGSSPDHRRFYDPAFYRIIVYDQRGAGHSTPLGELVDNTTAHLIADLERLRSIWHVERWLVFGGSWGSTLALAYAEAHPERVLGLVLRGIFLCRPWRFTGSCSRCALYFPKRGTRSPVFFRQAKRSDLLTHYYRRLIDPDPGGAYAGGARLESLRRLVLDAASRSRPGRALRRGRRALAIARIEAHYFANRMFLPANALLDGIDRMRELPCTIVQGRYDIVCPILSADDLHRAWPEANTWSLPTRGIRRASRESRASWSRRPIDFARFCARSEKPGRARWHR